MARETTTARGGGSRARNAVSRRTRAFIMPSRLVQGGTLSDAIRRRGELLTGRYAGLNTPEGQRARNAVRISAAVNRMLSRRR